MKNILVVEDEENMRDILNRLLLHQGYNVKMAENGIEAFNIIDSYEIDIVLLDLVLPDINGLEILKNIKEKYSSIEIIMVSGQGTFPDVVNLIKGGAYDYIEKPFDNTILLLKISNALKKRKLNLKFKYLDEQYNNIKKLKEYNESVLNHMYVGILTIDNEDMLNVYNSSIEKIFKMDSDRLQNKNVFLIFKEIFNEHDKIESYYWQLKDKNEEFDVLSLNNTIGDNKEKHHFRISGCRFSEGILLFITDITDEYNLKQRLLHSERISSIGQFISSITHGLGNNMANIIANTAGIVDEVYESKRQVNRLISKMKSGKKDKEIKEIKDRIIENQKRIKDYSGRLLKRTSEMSSNIKSLLNYSKNRHQQMIKSPTSINTIIEESINIVKNHKYEDIEFISEFDKDIPLINVNSYQIRDMFIDLALNGIHAMNGKERLTFKTRFIKEKKCIQICISDTGCGIPEEIRDKIFSAFFTTKKNGTGLGLANVKTTIKNNNGHISFQTEIDKGTTFYIELPVTGV